MRTFIAFAFALASMFPLAATAADLQAGDTAPDFELMGSDGKTHKLSELVKTETVVLAWFPKAFTGGCTTECKNLRANSAKLKALPIAYFTISCDDAETNRKFAESLELDYPILSDPDTKTAQGLGVLDPDKKRPRRWTFYIGPDRKILFIDKTIKPATAGEDIAARLAELGVGEKK